MEDDPTEFMRLKHGQLIMRLSSGSTESEELDDLRGRIRGLEMALQIHEMEIDEGRLPPDECLDFYRGLSSARMDFLEWANEFDDVDDVGPGFQ